MSSMSHSHNQIGYGDGCKYVNWNFLWFETQFRKIAIQSRPSFNNEVNTLDKLLGMFFSGREPQPVFRFFSHFIKFPSLILSYCIPSPCRIFLFCSLLSKTWIHSRIFWNSQSQTAGLNFSCQPPAIVESIFMLRYPNKTRLLS